MDRRDFIQRIAAAPVGLAATPLAAGGLVGCGQKPPGRPALPIQNPAGHLLWQNWSGLQHAYPAQRLGVMAEAALAAQLQAAVPPIRVALLGADRRELGFGLFDPPAPALAERWVRRLRRG